MKIIVPVKRVIDPNVKVRVMTDNSDVDLSNVKMALNPFCEIAVEAAIQLKEKQQAEEIIVVSIGAKECQEQLRTALALGADRAIHINATPENSLDVAKLLKAVVDQEQPGLVILGKQSVDADNNQTGQMLAALTDMPQAAFASEIDLQADTVTVNCEIDDGIQVLNLDLPALITTDLRLNEPRYASLPNIMKAKRKPLTETDAASLGVNFKNSLKTLRVDSPTERQAGIKVTSAKELLDKLTHEAKVI
ncbi:electron transfer flavoprotein subunit beta/FixA family protein [Aliamphritea ceti]|uniref:electron transfer flavoprotein subunit beta/FixA family protein n=1 Tax=Aliamphritea ceti TaxID=1524258 RepID=UPI0021C376E6|nr:electron transfer flavoprotein subunit beta/FixA family protein [Aliamphritea ceti]